MFTGLIQSLGIIRSLGEERLTVSVSGKTSSLILSDLAIGDSVAVDGVCLTVETILGDSFVVTVSPETLQRTILGDRSQSGAWVNLETSLRVGGKIGGHFVTGHIDGIGCLIDSVPTETSWEMTFTYPPDLVAQWQQAIAPYVVLKGSITVNGISLTIADCDRQGNWFKVAVIPHTYASTNLIDLKNGDRVNLESDILGKYIHKLVSDRLDYPTSDTDISLDFLAEHGYTVNN